MTKAYSWKIDMHVFGGRETHVWAVIDPEGKNILSGKELSRAAAVLAAMKAIQRLQQRPRYAQLLELLLYFFEPRIDAFFIFAG
jgi:hypothetical protein